MSDSKTRVVRVASGQGFWGDWLEAPRRQVEGGQVDYLMLDYLAEVTMSILQKQKERDPKMGYARDFIGAMESVFPAVAEKGVKVIGTFPADSHPAIIYPVAATTTAKPETTDYLAFLRSTAAKNILERYGFKFLVSPST